MTEAHPTEDLVAQHAAMLGAEPVNAVPYHMNGNDEYVVRDVFGGLTKREAFAMVAMGHLAASHVQGGHTFSGIVAEQAVEYADALLKELAK